jgi:hypothetical protein
MYLNGSYTLKGVGADIVLIPFEGDILKYDIQLKFPATNNIAEYEGLVTDLRLAKDLSIWWLFIRGDSQLVAKQVHKVYHCSNEKITEYLAEARRMEKFFDGFEVFPRLDNRDADHLVWITSFSAPTQPDVIIEKLSKPSVKPVSEADLMIIDEPDQESAYDWMNTIKIFLDNQPPSDDNPKVERIAHKSRMIDGVLYRQGANDMMMRCISREEGIQLLWDIHSGVCGSHLSWRSIIGKAFRHSFYWPTPKDDVMEVITKCKDYQFFQEETMKHANSLRSIDLSWPFVIWQINIVGVLLGASGGFRFLFITIDTFTKWMEVMPVVNITQEVVVKFL